ncbi:hypothetical protein AB0A91_16485 [Streptomyces sp. NPDC042207]|uniref:hypothetical protein n=1 Tax=Streptomyces sp. NPDC042207 TaxID=3154331 RepID=UPI0033E66BE0
MSKPETDEASLAAGRAAGYCWAQRPAGRGRCTRRPGHDGQHVDYYNGRMSPADTAGYSWRQ